MPDDTQQTDTGVNPLDTYTPEQVAPTPAAAPAAPSADTGQNPLDTYTPKQVAPQNPSPPTPQDNTDKSQTDLSKPPTLPKDREGMINLISYMQAKGMPQDKILKAIQEVKTLRPNVDFSVGGTQQGQAQKQIQQGGIMGAIEHPIQTFQNILGATASPTIGEVTPQQGEQARAVLSKAVNSGDANFIQKAAQHFVNVSDALNRVQSGQSTPGQEIPGAIGEVTKGVFNEIQPGLQAEGALAGEGLAGAALGKLGVTGASLAGKIGLGAAKGLAGDVGYEAAQGKLPTPQEALLNTVGGGVLGTKTGTGALGGGLLGAGATGLTGATVGGVGGALLAPPGKEAQGAEQGAATLGLGGLVLGGAGGAIGGIAKENAASLAENVGKALGLVGKISAGKAPEAIPQAIRGLSTIADNAPNIMVKDENGIQKAFDPAKATFSEGLQALNKTKSDLFNQWTGIAKQAGDTGAQFGQKDFENVIQKLSSGSQDTTTPFKNKVQSIISDIVDNYGTRNPDGTITFENTPLTRIDEFIKNINTDVNPLSDKAAATVSSTASQALREIMDNKIMSATGKGYQELRNKYSDLKSIENSMVNQFKKSARGVGSGVSNWVEGFGGLDTIVGILDHNPIGVAKGVGMAALGKMMKYLRSPEVRLQKAFKIIQESKGAQPKGISGAYNKVTGVIEGAMNPKIGELPESVKGTEGVVRPGEIAHSMGFKVPAEPPSFNSGVIPKELEPLYQEAKKYKSAEEFVKSNILKKDGVKYLDKNKYSFFGDFMKDIEKLNPIKNTNEIMQKSGEQFDIAKGIWGNDVGNRVPKNIEVSKVKIQEKELANKPTSSRKITEPIEVIKKGNKYLLVDGRHRLDQALFNKDNKIQAIVKDESHIQELTDLWNQVHGK